MVGSDRDDDDSSDDTNPDTSTASNSSTKLEIVSDGINVGIESVPVDRDTKSSFSDYNNTELPTTNPFFQFTQAYNSEYNTARF